MLVKSGVVSFLASYMVSLTFGMHQWSNAVTTLVSQLHFAVSRENDIPMRIGIIPIPIYSVSIPISIPMTR